MTPVNGLAGRLGQGVGKVKDFDAGVLDRDALASLPSSSRSPKGLV